MTEHSELDKILSNKTRWGRLLHAQSRDTIQNKAQTD